MKRLLALCCIPIILLAGVKPTVLIYSGTHGDEQVANTIVTRLREELRAPEKLSAKEQQLLRLVDVACVNDINAGGLAKKHRETVRGVDPNRDYGFWWDGEGNSPHPWSQPEVQTFAALVDQKRISLSVDIHDGMTKLLYPWGAVPFGTPDSAVFAGIASGIAEPSFLAKRFHPYYKGQFYFKIYQSCGTTLDFLYGSKGVTAFLVETSLQRAVDSSFEKIYADHRPILWKLLESSRAGIGGTVTDHSGKPIDAVITVVDEKGNALWPVSTDSAGNFHKITSSGKYNIRIEAQGYRTLMVKPLQLYNHCAQTIRVTLNESPRTYRFVQRIAGVSWPKILGYSKHFVFPFQNRTVPTALIGNPDAKFYSLEQGGSVILDLGKEITLSGNARLTITEKGVPEGYSISVSPTLFSNPLLWKKIGFSIGSSTVKLPQDQHSVRYIRIEDDGFGFKRKKFSGADIESVLLIE